MLDDWGLVGMNAQTRTDLLEMIDDRAGRKATVITSQLPIEHWHEWIGDATVADAMLDRIMQNHHRLTLTGESLRKDKPSLKKEENQGRKRRPSKIKGSNTTIGHDHRNRRSLSPEYAGFSGATQ